MSPSRIFNGLTTSWWRVRMLGRLDTFVVRRALSRRCRFSENNNGWRLGGRVVGAGQTFTMGLSRPASFLFLFWRRWGNRLWMLSQDVDTNVSHGKGIGREGGSSGWSWIHKTNVSLCGSTRFVRHIRFIMLFWRQVLCLILALPRAISLFVRSTTLFVDPPRARTATGFFC